MEIADGLDHGQRAPGKRAGRAARYTVLDLDIEVAKPIRTVSDPGAGHGIGDERDPALSCLPDHGCRNRCDVHPVEDQLHNHVGSCERRSRDSGIAMVERTHGVEEVRHAPHAEIERDVRLLRGRVGVAARDRDLAA